MRPPRHSYDTCLRQAFYGLSDYWADARKWQKIKQDAMTRRLRRKRVKLVTRFTPAQREQDRREELESMSWLGYR